MSLNSEPACGRSGEIMNDHVILATEGNAAQVFSAEREQMVLETWGVQQATHVLQRPTSVFSFYWFCCFLFDLILNGMTHWKWDKSALGLQDSFTLNDEGHTATLTHIGAHEPSTIPHARLFSCFTECVQPARCTSTFSTTLLLPMFLCGTTPS